jgi:hypothetical protein
MLFSSKGAQTLLQSSTETKQSETQSVIKAGVAAEYVELQRANGSGVFAKLDGELDGW